MSTYACSSCPLYLVKNVENNNILNSVYRVLNSPEFAQEEEERDEELSWNVKRYNTRGAKYLNIDVLDRPTMLNPTCRAAHVPNSR